MGLTKNLGWLSKYITADSTGKIGIGTASPNYGLNVVNSDLTLSGIVSNRFIGLRKENNTLPGYLGLLGGDNGDSALIIGYNSAGTQTLQISASTSPTYFNGGNVGIGTTSPTSKLHIYTNAWDSSQPFASIINLDNNAVDGKGLFVQAGADNSTSYIANFSTYSGNSALYVNGAGNVGIGTSTPASIVPGTNLTINGSSVGYGSLFLQSNNVDRAFFSADATNLLIGTAGASTNMLFYLGGSERVRMTVGGNVLIGTTTDNGAKLQVNGTVTASGRLSLGDGIVSNFNAISISSGVYTNTAAISIGASNPTGGVVSPIITFTAPNASYSYAVRGGMYYNGSNLQMEFRTTSDYRVKEDLIEDFNAIDLLDKIKIYDHKWIGASGRSYSVIAHELQDVIPYLVSGQKDAILEDGSMDLQSVDYSKLVPILIKGIQELTERIKTLENK